MILVDRALERREAEGRHIRVAMVGAGFMGRGIALQFVRSVKGMRLVAIANRHLDRARRAYADGGVDDVRIVEAVPQLEETIRDGKCAIAEDAHLVCRASGVDVVIDATGTVEFAAGIALEAIHHGKHVVLVNAELDGTLGPVLQRHAQRAGVVVTDADGDQPAVVMNLYRFVRGIGVRPLLCGSIKGLHDRYRNPTTQAAFARQWGQNPRMVTSFADGTKVAFEQAVVANATGMRVARRGMLGPTVPEGTPITQAVNAFPSQELTQGSGIVDYVVGAAPSPGVFVVGTHDHPAQKHYLNLYKLGAGPFYCFHTPYHLCHFEVPTTVARVAEFGDAATAPIGGPVCEVMTCAKRDLKAGDVLDGIGGFTSYGLLENRHPFQSGGYLPMGLSEGCRLKRDVPKDCPIVYRDVDVPVGRLSDALRAEQDQLFPSLPQADPSSSRVPISF